MTVLPPPSARLARQMKNVALFCALSGFALELGGGIAGQPAVFRFGLLLFLLAVPLFLIGLFLGRRKQ